jgi:transcriptional regulator with XRE-family HTH domain
MTPKQFKQTRKDLNLTQRQLAKELGLSEKNGDVYIRKVENGRCEPSGLLIKCFELYCRLSRLYLKIEGASAINSISWLFFSTFAVI